MSTYFNDRRNNSKPVQVPDMRTAALNMMRNRSVTGGELYPGATPLMNDQQFANANANRYDGVAPLEPQAGASSG